VPCRWLLGRHQVRGGLVPPPPPDELPGGLGGVGAGVGEVACPDLVGGCGGVGGVPRVRPVADRGVVGLVPVAAGGDGAVAGSPSGVLGWGVPPLSCAPP
jgi:hypothetical protein